MKPRSGKSALAALAYLQDGGLNRVALALKLHPNTLSNASIGLPVSKKTRSKLEQHFKLRFEDLQRPFAELVAEILERKS